MITHNKPSLDKEILRPLYRRIVWPWLRDAALDWGMIVSAVLLVHAFSNPATWLIALLIIGNRQHALTILGHDGTHFTLSENKTLNDFLTNLIAFWPIGLTITGYRILHVKHHTQTGTETDPELGHKRARSPQWDLPAKPSRILKYAAYDIFGYSFPDYMIILRYSKPATQKEYIPLACFHLIAISLLAVTGLWWAGLFWYGGLITTFMMSFRLRLWLEHQGTPETHRLHLNAFQGGLLAPHNSWMHWEHHNWPAIPYHRLGKLRALTAGQPVMSLKELLHWFATREYIASGTAIGFMPSEMAHRSSS